MLISVSFRLISMQLKLMICIVSLCCVQLCSPWGLSNRVKYRNQDVFSACRVCTSGSIPLSVALSFSLSLFQPLFFPFIRYASIPLQVVAICDKRSSFHPEKMLMNGSPSTPSTSSSRFLDSISHANAVS